MKIILFLLFILYSHSFNIPVNNVPIKWNKSPDSTWAWKENSINYIKHENDHKQALLLIHGFGSSSFHWRYNIDELSKRYDVYAIDLLGFGKSSKPLSENYSVELWKNQTNDFINDIIQKDTIIVGNSLGGFVSLQTLSNSFVNGAILINSYCKFKDDKTIKLPYYIISPLTELYFHFFKNKNVIKNTLKAIYPINPHLIDDNLVESIIEPSKHVNALRVLKNITSNFINNDDHVDNILINNNKPIFIIWGSEDKWINKSMLNKILLLNNNIKFKYVQAGHCPQDEISSTVNDLIDVFIKTHI